MAGKEATTTKPAAKRTRAAKAAKATKRTAKATPAAKRTTSASKTASSVVPARQRDVTTDDGRITADRGEATDRDVLLEYDLAATPTGSDAVPVEPGGIDPRLVEAREVEKARRAGQEVTPSALALIDPRLIADRARLKARQAELRKGRPATEGFQSS